MQFEDSENRFALFAEHYLKQKAEDYSHSSQKKKNYNIFQRKNKNVEGPGHDWRESSIISQWRELDAQIHSKY
jgi:hypothetical protein